MERTITFIAEHKKREYDQLKDGTEVDNSLPQDQQDLCFEPGPNSAELIFTCPTSRNDI